MRLFINDGFNLAGKVEKIPGLCPEINFTYRPALDLAMDLVASAVSAEMRYDAKATVIHDHLVSFAATDDADGLIQAMVLTKDQVKQLPGPAFRTLFNFIVGYNGPIVAIEGNG